MHFQWFPGLTRTLQVIKDHLNPKSYAKLAWHSGYCPWRCKVTQLKRAAMHPFFSLDKQHSQRYINTVKHSVAVTFFSFFLSPGSCSSTLLSNTISLFLSIYLSCCHWRSPQAQLLHSVAFSSKSAILPEPNYIINISVFTLKHFSCSLLSLQLHSIKGSGGLNSQDYNFGVVE